MGQLAPNPFAASAPTDLNFPEPKKKTGLIVAVVVVALVAAGAGIVLATSKPTAPAPPPVPTVTAQPPSSESTAPTATATSTSESAPPSGPRTGGELPSGPTPAQQAQNGGDFSQMFAAGAEKAQKGGPSSTKAFDAEEAKTAVAGVLKSVAACKEPGGPTGQANAAITFAASGQVTSVTIGAPFAGTTTGTCIISAFKAAKVGAFTGLPGTVSQPVSLQ